MADDKTTLAYWMRQTGGRKNAAYTLKKEYTNALAGRGPGPRTLKKDMVPPTYKAPKAPTASTAMPPVGTRGVYAPFKLGGNQAFTRAYIAAPIAALGAVTAGAGALIAAPAIVAGVGAVGSGALGAGLAGAGGFAAKFVRGAGGAVSKGARSAASPWVKPVTRTPKRVPRPKPTPKPKPKPKPKPTNPTAAMDYHTGALAGQSAKMGGSGARR